MPADPRLANLPALRKLAEEWAMRHYALLRYRLASPTQSGGSPWGDMDARYQEAAIDAAMDWLGDLRYPEARDAVARLVAAKLWPDASSLTTAPSLYWTAEAHDSTDCDGAPNGDGWPEGWWLNVGDGNMHFFSWDDWCPDPDAHTMIVGLNGVTDPAEALTLIALHVLGIHDAHR